jgi:hypothetical protein
VSLDLKNYLDRFGEVCQSKFGQTYDFSKLEKTFTYLRSEDQWLVAKHVEKAFDPRNTPFARYWPQPNLKNLDQILRQARVKLAPLPLDPRSLIQTLLTIFHIAGTASLLLRFTYPERFGVFSTPVINLLQIQRPKSVELYLAYCEELRVWQEHFRLRSVAETEMALWTYQQLASEERLGNDAFEQDVWIQRRRAAQVLGPFFRNYGALELARILAEESPKLAGMIAGEEYERLLRGAARRFYPSLDTQHKGWADAVIDLMVQRGYVALEEKQRLREVWRQRNNAVHPGAKLDAIQVEKMIDSVQSICSRWARRAQPKQERVDGRP